METCADCQKSFDSAEALGHHRKSKHGDIQKQRFSYRPKKAHLILALILIVIISYSTWTHYQNQKPGKYDSFAQCLTEKGMLFYGAFWCSHCAEQKELFGKSIRYINYIECSTPDGNGKMPICEAAHIKGYPTWADANGTHYANVQQLDQLSAISGCPFARQ